MQWCSEITLSLRTTWDAEEFTLGNRLRLVLKVPEDAPLELRTGSDDVVIRRVRGFIAADVATGQLDVAGQQTGARLCEQIRGAEEEPVGTGTTTTAQRRLLMDRPCPVAARVSG